MICLTKLLVVKLKHLGRFSSELWLKRAADLDVCLKLFHCEVRVEGPILQPVHVDYMLGNVEVILVVLLIEDDKEEVEA